MASGDTRFSKLSSLSIAALAGMLIDDGSKWERQVSGKDDELANLIARIGTAKAPRQGLFEHAKRGVY
jgi:hypothetical protein